MDLAKIERVLCEVKEGHVAHTSRHLETDSFLHVHIDDDGTVRVRSVAGDFPGEVVGDPAELRRQVIASQRARTC